MALKVIATNRKAYHNYSILETFEAGLSLTGTEIKSIRLGRISLAEAYVRPEKGELWLINAHVPRYQEGSWQSHEPTRPRRLLMHRSQIRYLTSQVAEKGLTIVPLRLYIKDSRAKLEIALARGKKLYDKREAIARREADRHIERTLKTK